METWKTLWTVLFAVSCLLFAGLSVWVIIGGWKDLMEMLKDLKAARDGHSGNDSNS